jgi:hypothetical protein
MKTRLILSAALLTLAACGRSGDGAGGNAATGATGSTGGSASAAGISLQPGEWEMKTEVVNVTAEGLPPGIADSMKQQAGGTTRSCMTAEDAKGPKGDMFTRGQGANCKSEGFSWSGGSIKGKTTCTGSGGATGKVEMTMDGRYDAQSIDMTLKSKTDVAGHAMSTEMRISGKRVGECSAATKEG